MSLKQRIDKDMVEAMKQKEALRLSTLRMIKSAIKNREIDEMKELDDAAVIKTLNTLVKQRRDSAEQYLKGNRNDLAEKELAEIKIIEEYLPAALSEAEIAATIDAAISETGAKSIKDMGTVMKATMAKLAGQSVEGKMVSEIVKSKLSSL